MSVFYIMVPVSILLALVFLFGFLWSVRNGQYEDTYTPSVRILFEDGVVAKESTKTTEETSNAEPLNDIS